MFTFRTAVGGCRSFTRERTVPSGDDSPEPYYTVGRRVRVEEAAVGCKNTTLSDAFPDWITTRIAIDRDTPSGDDVTLYRPVGRKELLLIMESRLHRFPPRLEDQPIFYPVLDEPYAIQIARGWNARDAGFGYVTRFRIPRSCFASFEVHTVGVASIGSSGCQPRNSTHSKSASLVRSKCSRPTIRHRATGDSRALLRVARNSTSRGWEVLGPGRPQSGCSWSGSQGPTLCRRTPGQQHRRSDRELRNGRRRPRQTRSPAPRAVPRTGAGQRTERGRCSDQRDVSWCAA